MSKPTRPEGALRLFLRSCLHILGLIGIVFGWYGLAQPHRTIEKLAQKIVLGQTYDAATLRAVLAQSDLARAGCDVSALRSLAIVRAQLASVVIANGDLGTMDAAGEQLSGAVDRLLACSPREPFGWLMRYWLETRKNGMSASAIEALSRSYRFGPREAWIAIRRNRMALGVRGYLPQTLRKQSATEFLELLQLQLFEPLADTLSGLSQETQGELIRQAAELPDTIRIKFAFALRARGLRADELQLQVQPWRWWRLD